MVRFPGNTHTDKTKCIAWMYCKSLWIKTSAKCKCKSYQSQCWHLTLLSMESKWGSAAGSIPAESNQPETEVYTLPGRTEGFGSVANIKAVKAPDHQLLNRICWNAASGNERCNQWESAFLAFPFIPLEHLTPFDTGRRRDEHGRIYWTF